jgi:hypothetical protein
MPLPAYGQPREIAKEKLAVVVPDHFLAQLPGELGVPPRIRRVAGKGMGACERLVGVRAIELLELGLVPRAQLDASARVEEGRFGPAERRVHTRQLPVTAHPIDPASYLPPVVARRVRRVQHAVVLLGRALLELEQPPHLVEEVRRESPLSLWLDQSKPSVSRMNA